MNVTKKYISGVLALATVAGMGFALPIFAQSTGAAATTPPSGWTRGAGGMRGGVMGARPAAMGTVSNIGTDASGNVTFTVTGKQFTKPAVGSPAGTAPTSTTVTYTVDTTSATTVTKTGAASTLSAIANGDTVVVAGTVSGTTVTATSIRDGAMPRGQGGKAGGSASANAEANLVAGNGQPVIGGTITVIDGNTLTVTNKSAVVYAVSVSGTTKFVQGQTTTTLSGLKQGDNVIVQGTVNGTNVTASTVIDQGQPATTGTTGTAAKHSGFLGGIFGGIGSFFSHLFGF